MITPCVGYAFNVSGAAPSGSPVSACPLSAPTYGHDGCTNWDSESVSFAARAQATQGQCLAVHEPCMHCTRSRVSLCRVPPCELCVRRASCVHCLCGPCVRNRMSPCAPRSRVSRVRCVCAVCRRVSCVHCAREPCVRCQPREHQVIIPLVEYTPRLFLPFRNALPNRLNCRHDDVCTLFTCAALYCAVCLCSCTVLPCTASALHLVCDCTASETRRRQVRIPQVECTPGHLVTTP